MARSVFRYSLAAFGMVLLGIAASAIFGNLRADRNAAAPATSTRRAAAEPVAQPKEKEALQATPEGTVSAFITALKTGDTNRAADFFVPEQQAQWREDLALAQNKNILAVMIGDLEQAERQRDAASHSASFARTDKNGKKLINLLLELHSGIWQISDLE